MQFFLESLLLHVHSGLLALCFLLFFLATDKVGHGFVFVGEGVEFVGDGELEPFLDLSFELFDGLLGLSLGEGIALALGMG